MQTEVALRIATMDQTSPEIISSWNGCWNGKSPRCFPGILRRWWHRALAELLNRVDRATENPFWRPRRKNQELAVEIKKLMFTFDDVIP